MAYDFPSSPTLGQVITGPNGIQYSWDGVKWLAAGSTSTQTWAPAGAINDVGRNLLHNPLFNIAQRGAGPFATNGVYTADRWAQYFTLDTLSTSVYTVAPGGLGGDEGLNHFIGMNFTGNSGATAFSSIVQRIENVSRLSGKTVTISFGANTGSGTMKLGVTLAQVFGTGGSPSATVFVNGQAISLTTTQGRYSATFTLPSVVGKTLGSNGDDYTQLAFYLSSGANANTVAGGIGVQSGTINIWGVQLEIGTAATPLEKPDPQQDLAKCQRFYQTGNFGLQGYAPAAAITVGYEQTLSVTMRAIPTCAIASETSATGMSTRSIAGDSVSQMRPSGICGANGGFSWTGTFTASADL